MLLSAYTMRDGVVRLKRIALNLENIKKRAEKNNQEIDEEELAIQYRSFYAAALDILNGAEELRIILNMDKYQEHNYIYDIHYFIKDTGMRLLERGPDLQNILDIASGISGLLNIAESRLSLLEDSYYTLNREYSGYYNTSPESLTDDFLYNIANRSIKLQGEGELQCLDYLEGYSYGQESSITLRRSTFPAGKYYGFNLPEDYKRNLTSYYEKLALGQMKGTVISNGVFDVMTIHCKPELSKPNNAMFVKKEKILLRDTAKYLREDGLLILTIPYFRLHRDVSVLIAKNYTDVQVRKLPGEKFNTRGQVILFARKKSDEACASVDEDTVEFLRSLWDKDKIVDILDEPFQEVHIAPKNLEIKFFRGSSLDLDELASIAKNSSATAEFWSEQNKNSFASEGANPLLPFNVGQLGLVLTSGSLDGIIDEGYGNYHVVKGRVRKTTENQREAVAHTGGDRVQVVSTVSNRVEINIMLPDGTYKTLA